jgi:alpha-tubulin suppressor-like RCC1 family protein
VNWTTIPAATCASSATTCDDTTASALGERRWYRVESSAMGAQTLTTAVVDGWRLAFEGIAAGENSSCGRTPLTPDGGRLWCWGANFMGQAGLGTTNFSVSVPTLVPSMSNVVEISSAGTAAHFCARKTDNTVWCWGWNADGQIGDGTSGTSNQIRATPKQVSGVEAVALALGSRHSCAIVLGLGARCWGRNDSGQLGDNSTENRTLPVQVKTGPSTNLVQVASIGLGNWHSCATRTNGEVWCWGANNNHQLGQTTPTSSTVAIRATALSGATAVVGGESFTCTLASQAVHCWGGNAYGELGNGQVGGTTAAPQLVTGVTSSLIAIGRSHGCALLTGPQAGEVACWGRNHVGQLGVGDQTNRSTPTNVQNSDGTGELDSVTALSAGAYHNCVVRNGQPLCWGNNVIFGLGDGTDTNRSRPTEVVLP